MTSQQMSRHIIESLSKINKFIEKIESNISKSPENRAEVLSKSRDYVERDGKFLAGSNPRTKTQLACSMEKEYLPTKKKSGPIRAQLP